MSRAILRTWVAATWVVMIAGCGSSSDEESVEIDSTGKTVAERPATPAPPAQTPLPEPDDPSVCDSEAPVPEAEDPPVVEPETAEVVPYDETTWRGSLPIDPLAENMRDEILPNELKTLANVLDFYASTDGTTLVTHHDRTGETRIYDLVTGKRTKTLDYITPKAVSPDGRFLVMVRPRDGYDEYKLDVLHIASRKLKSIKAEHKFVRLPEIDFSHDGRKVVLAWSNSLPHYQLGVFDLASGRMRKTDLVHHAYPLWIDCSPVEPTVAVSRRGFDEEEGILTPLIEIYDVETLEIKKVIPLPEEAYSVCYSLDGSTLAAVTERANVFVLDAKTWKLRYKVQRKYPMLQLDDEIICMTPDGGYVVTLPWISPHAGEPCQRKVEVYEVGSGKMHEIDVATPRVFRSVFMLPQVIMVTIGIKSVEGNYSPLLFFDPVSGQQRFPPFPLAE